MSTDNTNERRRTGSGDIDIEMRPTTDQIPTEAIVDILVKKGICTHEDLVKLEPKKNGEGKYDFPAPTNDQRQEHSPQKEATFINIKNPYDRGKFPALKKAMSRHRWSRKLGSMLFGWKWKKVKKTSEF